MVTKIEVIYYAKCSQTGMIWEAQDFRSLYNAVRREFRNDVHRSSYYDCRGAVLRYGVLISESDGSMRYESYKDIAYMFVSGCSHEIRSCDIERWE